MSTFGMEMIRDKNVSMMPRGDWRNMIGCYDNRPEDGLPPMMHKNYPAGSSAAIPALPSASPSLLTSRQSLPSARPTAQTTQPSLFPTRTHDKSKEFQSYPWPKKENMFAVNQSPNIPNGFYNQNQRLLKKEELMYPRRETNGYPDRSMYNYHSPVPPHTMSTLNALRASSDGSNSVPKSAISWKMNGMSSNSSTKSSPGAWSSLKESDKDVWENRMKENAELLKLYKHGYADFNQNVFPGHPGKPVSNGYIEDGKSDPNRDGRDSRDKIYLNINLQKDKIDYEPLSKNASNASSSPYRPQINSPSRQMNGYKNSSGVLISTEVENKKNSFSVDNIIDRNSTERNGSVDDLSTNYRRTHFEHPNSRLKSWRSNSVTNISERVDSLKNGHTKSAFSPPHTSKASPPKPLDTPKSPEYPNNHIKSPEISVGDSPKENKPFSVDLPPKEQNKSINERQLDTKNNNSNGHTEYTLPFKIKMKRSLAIYLGVDPEIDTVQYEPLNKNANKGQTQHVRHVYSKGHDMGHKDDRDTRIQSKKKSVYSCGYDVNSINLMLQNAKKRFKCSDSS